MLCEEAADAIASWWDAFVSKINARSDNSLLFACVLG
jgi:hypothetical protein